MKETLFVASPNETGRPHSGHNETFSVLPPPPFKGAMQPTFRCYFRPLDIERLDIVSLF